MPDYEFGSDGQSRPAQTSDATAPRDDTLTSVDSFETSEPGSASQRLRDFEHEHLGADVVRSKLGHVERGSGSLFQDMPEEKRKAHGLLEKAVETEQKLAEAHANLLKAEDEHNAAVAAAEDASRFGG